MRLAFFQRDIDVLFRLIPFATGIAAALLAVVPNPMPGLAVATPAFALMVVYHWTVYRPDLMPPSGVFLIGVSLDLLSGTPYIGISALALLAARTLVLVTRRYIVNQPFAIAWAGFAAAAAAAIGLEWLLLGGLNGMLLGSRPFIFQLLVSVAAYPLASYLLAQIQRATLSRA